MTLKTGRNSCQSWSPKWDCHWWRHSFLLTESDRKNWWKHHWDAGKIQMVNWRMRSLSCWWSIHSSMKGGSLTMSVGMPIAWMYSCRYMLRITVRKNCVDSKVVPNKGDYFKKGSASFQRFIGWSQRLPSDAREETSIVDIPYPT